MNENDWSEMANQFSLGPQQIFWKVKRLIKEEEKKKSNASAQDPTRTSRREMIAKAL